MYYTINAYIDGINISNYDYYMHHGYIVNEYEDDNSCYSIQEYQTLNKRIELLLNTYYVNNIHLPSNRLICSQEIVTKLQSNLLSNLGIGRIDRLRLFYFEHKPPQLREDGRAAFLHDAKNAKVSNELVLYRLYGVSAIRVSSRLEKPETISVKYYDNYSRNYDIYDMPSMLYGDYPMITTNNALMLREDIVASMEGRIDQRFTEIRPVEKM
jgi:hypothetical protein